MASAGKVRNLEGEVNSAFDGFVTDIKGTRISGEAAGSLFTSLRKLVLMIGLNLGMTTIAENPFFVKMVESF